MGLPDHISTHWLCTLKCLMVLIQLGIVLEARIGTMKMSTLILGEKIAVLL